MAELFTLGYEGCSQEQFLKVLRSRGVQTLLDVRDAPISRKKGFSKNSLAEGCERAGIAYEHAKVFGCPKEIREPYRADGDWAKYTIAYKKHLAKLGNAVEQLSARALTEKLCLVCFEANPLECHRLYVAEAAREISRIDVVHLCSTDLAKAASRS